MTDSDWTRVVFDHVKLCVYAAFVLDPDGNNIEAVHRGEYPESR